MQHLLSRADRALGRLDGSIQTLPNPDLFVLMYVRKEAVLSNQIEGTQASIDDLLRAEAQRLGPERRDDVEEVLNYVTAMNFGLTRLAELPLSIRLIREIHQRLMDGVRGRNRQPGEVRTSQNWIGPEGGGLGDATFVPPPPTVLADTLGDFERFLHAHTDMPALIKFGLAHAQLETIHPFLDGNGRVGRLLITFLLCENEILTKPVLYISYYFKRHRQRYYDLLQGTRDDGDWETWLKFFLTGVAEVSNEATETARAIIGLREQHRNIITDQFGRATANALRALEYLFQVPVVHVRSIQDLTGTSYPAANNLVAKLVEQGILYEITGQARNRLYRYSPYVDLFATI